MPHLQNSGQFIKIIRPLGSPSSISSTADKSEPSLLNYSSSSGYDSPSDSPPVEQNVVQEPTRQMGFLEELKKLAEKRRTDCDSLLLDSLKKTITIDKMPKSDDDGDDKMQDISEIIVTGKVVKMPGQDLEKKRQHGKFANKQQSQSLIILCFADLLMEEFKTAHLKMFKDKKPISNGIDKLSLPEPVVTNTETPTFSTAALIEKFSRDESSKKFKAPLDVRTSSDKVFLSRWHSSTVLSGNLVGRAVTKNATPKPTVSVKEMTQILTNNAQNIGKPRVATPILQDKVKILATKRVSPTSSPNNSAFQLFKSSSCMNVSDRENVFMIPRVRGIQILSTRSSNQQTTQQPLRFSKVMSKVKVFEREQEPSVRFMINKY